MTDRPSKVALLALYRNPLAMVTIAERAAGAKEARFQLAMLDSLDLEVEGPAQRARVVQWREALCRKAGSLSERVESLERQHSPKARAWVFPSD